MSVENGCDYYFDCADCECSHCLVVKQRTEIERLTAEINQRREMMSRMNCNYATELQKNDALQKQVDELKENLGLKETLYKRARESGYCTGYKSAVKDTAKEILQKIMNIIKKSDGFLAEEVIRIMAKQKGVEVE